MFIQLPGVGENLLPSSSGNSLV